MSIVDAVYSYLPAKRKQTPSGWTKFNAVCCTHNGNTTDTRQRGGIIQNSEGCSYHCFNCGFKASYVAGRHLSRKMRQLLQWLGAPDDVITKLSLEAMKIEEDEHELEKISLPNLVDKDLPEGSLPLKEWAGSNIPAELSAKLIDVIGYISDRNLNPYSGDFYWTPVDGWNDRVVVPFRFEGRIVGYTARKITDGKPKYISDQTPGYVFNLDCQNDLRQFVIVCEGPMDALSIDGVAILGADIMDKQAMFINRLNREIVVLPDKDKDGARTVERAIELGWSVSMPDLGDCKDANDAVRKFGRIWTLKRIADSRESNSLKIRLQAKTWFKENDSV
jgi:hypothetical protein